VRLAVFDNLAACVDVFLYGRVSLCFFVLFTVSAG
jgi:hypothetical protein